MVSYEFVLHFLQDLNSSTVSSLEQSADLDIALIEDEEWLQKEKHVFILSSAGKPIYSRYVPSFL